jgi:hypothetical protein
VLYEAQDASSKHLIKVCGLDKIKNTISTNNTSAFYDTISHKHKVAGSSRCLRDALVAAACRRPRDSRRRTAASDAQVYPAATAQGGAADAGDGVLSGEIADSSDDADPW